MAKVKLKDATNAQIVKAVRNNPDEWFNKHKNHPFGIELGQEPIPDNIGMDDLEIELVYRKSGNLDVRFLMWDEEYECYDIVLELTCFPDCEIEVE